MHAADLEIVADELEEDAGIMTPANDSQGGQWLRIAFASEELAGASTEANDAIPGFMLRAALALESIAGTSGAEENDSIGALLKRIVDALEVQAGEVTVGSLESRMVTAAQNAVFGPPAIPAPASPDGAVAFADFIDQLFEVNSSPVDANDFFDTFSVYDFDETLIGPIGYEEAFAYQSVLSPGGGALAAMLAETGLTVVYDVMLADTAAHSHDWSVYNGDPVPVVMYGSTGYGGNIRMDSPTALSAGAPLTGRNIFAFSWDTTRKAICANGGAVAASAAGIAAWNHIPLWMSGGPGTSVRSMTVYPLLDNTALPALTAIPLAVSDFKRDIYELDDAPSTLAGIFPQNSVRHFYHNDVTPGIGWRIDNASTAGTELGPSHGFGALLGSAALNALVPNGFTAVIDFVPDIITAKFNCGGGLESTSLDWSYGSMLWNPYYADDKVQFELNSTEDFPATEQYEYALDPLPAPVAGERIRLCVTVDKVGNEVRISVDGSAVTIMATTNNGLDLSDIVSIQFGTDDDNGPNLPYSVTMERVVIYAPQTAAAMPAFSEG